MSLRSTLLATRYLLNALGLLSSLCTGVAVVLSQSYHFDNSERRPGSVLKKLSIGESDSGVLRSGESATFSIELNVGEAATMTVDQINADLTCSIAASLADRPFLRIDHQARLAVAESVLFVADATGTYFLTVTSKYRRPNAARFSVTYSAVAKATTAQQARFEIDRSITNAYRARAEGFPKDAAAYADAALAEARLRFSESHLLAGVINEAGMFAYWNGDVRRFRALAEESWSLLETRPETDPARLHAQENLAFAYRMTGDLSRSGTLNESLLQLRTKELGEAHPSIAPILGELAVLKRAKGDYEAAADLSRRSLVIRESWLGPDHPDVVLSLQNLAAISYAIGDYEGYVQFIERSLRIRRKNLPPGHPDIARSLMDLGSLRMDLKDFREAEALLKESLAIRERAFGNLHPISLLSRFSLGSLYEQQEGLPKAAPIFDEVLRTLPQIESGISRSQTILIMQGLGGFYTAAGQYRKAEEILLKALDERIALNGSAGFDAARSYDDLARLYAKTGQVAEALRYQRRSNSIAEKHLQTLLKRGSEQQKLNLIEGIALGVNQSISLHADIAPENPEALNLALETILDRKGRVLDALLATQARLNASTAEAARLRARLAEVNSTLSSEFLTRSVARTQAWKARIDELISARRDVFGTLDPDPNEDSSKLVTIDSVRAAIPADAALIEIKVYRPFGTSLRFGKEEIIAYVIHRDGPIEWVKLGNAGEIDKLVEQFRNALRDPRSDIAAITRKLSDRIAAPIINKTGSSLRLIVSPDGPLNMVPFQALKDAKGTYLTERFTFTYVTSGRDLVRSLPEEPAEGSIEVFADPSFGSADGKASQNTPLPAYFQPLRATRREADLLRAIFPDARVYVGVEAAEVALKSIERPKLLHIATHGFFLPDDPAQKGARAGFWKPEFQLFRSGLVFANVNARQQSGDDGVLTALEATSLDLRGTKLVVLSACDTGVGTVRNGEGVYGLRRAFTIAGAEALVMSLWQVGDHPTQELMAGYYKNLKNGQGRADSLRSVQIEMIKKATRRHPYYWASFIHAGAWTPLEGGR